MQLPEGHRVPDGATFYEGDDDGRCRVIKLDGKRCGATRIRALGICPGHAGRGGVALDPSAAGKRGAAERQRRASARLVLGVSARRAAQPLQAARVAAQLRADDIARGLVDDVLDGDLKPGERHRALVETAKLLYPQVTAQLDVPLPGDEDEVRALSWEQLQQLAAQHLGDDGGTPVVSPALNGA